jgi:hypothetical protein
MVIGLQFKRLIVIAVRIVLYKLLDLITIYN